MLGCLGLVHYLSDAVTTRSRRLLPILTTLVALTPSRYKAAAGLSGYLDMESWVKFSERQEVIFDATNPEEVRLRNPMAFAASLKIPLILFAERGHAVVSASCS